MSVGQTAAIPTAERGTRYLGMGRLFSSLSFSFSFFAFSLLKLIVNLVGGDWKSERIHRVTRDSDGAQQQGPGDEWLCGPPTWQADPDCLPTHLVSTVPPG